MTTKKLNIYEKLVEIRKGVDSLVKGTQGHGFKFTPSSQVIKSVRDAMNEQGVLLIPKVTGKEVSPHITSGGKNWYFTELIMEFEWVNAEAPADKFSVPWYGQGVDDAEKGVGKALTYAEKYLVLKQFNIPTDKDDPDASKPPEETKTLTDADHKKTVNQMTKDLASKGTTPEAVSKWWSANSKKIADLPKKFQGQVTKEFNEYKKKNFVKCPNNKDQVIHRDVCGECQVDDCPVRK